MKEICGRCYGEGKVHEADFSEGDSEHNRFLMQDTLRDCPECKGKGFVGELTREEAAAIVKKYVFKIGVYEAVSLTDVCTILTPDGLAQLRSDRIRNLGPTKETIYPWNVIDLLVMRQ